MLILHPKIYLDPQGNHTNALLIEAGKVIATGDQAIALGGKTHEQRRPQAQCLFPALTDAHAHPWGLSQRPDTLSLAAARSTAQLYQALREHAATLATPQQWLIGTHWDQHQWTDAQSLSLKALDQATGDRPTLLYRVDYHAIWCNSAALKRAGLPIGPHTTGLLVDDDMHPALDALGPTTEAEDERMLLEHARRYRALGITCVHQAYMGVKHVAMLQRLKAQGKLPIRVYGMVDGLDPALPELLNIGPHHDPDVLASVACIKLFADGAMGSQGALMLEPYLDGTNGQAIVDAQQLKQRIPDLMSQGWQVAAHAIGDQAARALLDAFALATPEQRHKLRPRHEHAQLMTDDDIARLRELNVIASVQPIHLYSDMPWAHRVLQPHQLDRLYRFADHDTHTTLAAGSDTPIDDPNPFKGLATFISRRAKDGQSYAPQQRLTHAQALAAYTTGAAYAAHWEHHLGQLHPGFIADLIALPLDPFTASPEDLFNTLPLDTITTLPTL